MPIGSLVSGALVPQSAAPVVMAANGMLPTVLGLYFCWCTGRSPGL